MKARNKTASEVIGYLRKELIATELPNIITGKIYRDGDRPKDSQKEDVVLIHTAGLGGQTQTGIITIHLFVPEPNRGRRTQELEIALADALVNLPIDAIQWGVSEVPQSHKLDDVQQHFIHTKIRYKLFNI